MGHLGRAILYDENHQKLSNFMSSFDTTDYERMAVLLNDHFIGYVGVKRTGGPDHPP